MAFNSNLYMHESDKAALNALKSIPAFTQVMKSFMSMWNEKMFLIQNMSSNIKVSDKQMKKYYDMLPPICEKLGIDIPELYITLNVQPNAYTYGDTKPFIVLTSGLLESLPDSLIPTVLAHECGHIACHHTLYRTIGQMILNGTISIPGINVLLSLPLQAAFFYWMRCSEYSADRAAALCNGSAKEVIDMCFHFAGYNKNIDAEIDLNEFMNQAEEYQKMMDDSSMNKTMEFMMFGRNTHPLNAVRAYECNKWVASEQFTQLIEDFDLCIQREQSEGIKKVTVPFSSSSLLGKKLPDVINSFKSLGFTNIETKKSIEKQFLITDGMVVSYSIGDNQSFDKETSFFTDSPVVITYYEHETEEEAIAAHPGMIRIPNSSGHYLFRNYKECLSELKAAGFSNINIVEQKTNKKNWLAKNEDILRIEVDGKTSFESGFWFQPEVEITLTYYIYTA